MIEIWLHLIEGDLLVRKLGVVEGNRCHNSSDFRAIFEICWVERVGKVGWSGLFMNRRKSDWLCGQHP
jgi:hypothetical protein